METWTKVEVEMYRDLTIRIPESLLFKLEREAEEQGKSLETICFSLLSGQKQESLVNPNYYPSLTLEVLRAEIRKVIESDLTPEETRKRVTAIEFHISKRYIR